jgi:glycosyltransferase involved in cell wall biosynthesis
VPEVAPVTVAIPTCNGARHVYDSVRSVLAQRDVAFDLVVSDDRSDDDTLGIVRAAAGDGARVEVNSERLGLAGNWNRCVALSRTPWVSVFHQDDVMRRGHLAAHMAATTTDPALGLICSTADVIDSQGLAVPPSLVPRGDLGPDDRHFAPGAFIAELAASNPVRCSAVTLRKEAHEAVGGFDRSYRYAVDWEFWLRVARTWSLAWLAQATVAVRWHPESETHRFRTGTIDLDEVGRLLDNLFAQEDAFLPNARRLRRAANHGLARAYLNRAHQAIQGGDSALSRHCLRRSLTLWPRILGSIFIDPRLTIQMAAVVVAPRTARRWLSKSSATPPAPSGSGEHPATGDRADLRQEGGR